MLPIYYSKSLNSSYDHPSHKRRFPRYALRNNIDFKDFIPTKFATGINIVTLQSDITFWKKQKLISECKIIFDANDPLLLPTKSSFKDTFRGLFKYLSGNQKYLELDYKNSYLNLCKVSDAVVVGHFKQYEYLKKIIKNVILIPDYGLTINIKSKKSFKLSKKGTINIFWEGLGSSFKPFRFIEKIFEPINHKFNFIFHFVTDLTFFKYGDKYVKKNMKDFAKKESPSLYKQFRFYNWSEETMNDIGIYCDFAIIPLPLDNSMNYWKPENKLIHMWRMALPTITSKIPSYNKVMTESNINLCANDNDSWRDLILSFCEDFEKREKSGLNGKKYVDEFYSNNKIDSMWESCINRLQK